MAAIHHCRSPRLPLPGGITTANLAAVGKRRLKAGTLTSRFLTRTGQICALPVHLPVSASDLRKPPPGRPRPIT
jgi:hypothetical protein